MSRLNTAIIAGAMLFTGFTAFAQPVTVTYSYNGLPLPILPDSADVITVAQITVLRALTISKVTVQLQILYPNTGDLKVYLYSPQGTRTILTDHDCSVANIDTTFDDSASSTWKSFCPAEAGRGPFQADQPLGNFNSDTSSYGIWRLAVENDSSDSRSGWINQISLTITGNVQLAPTVSAGTIVNTASLSSPGIVAPGELITIFGAGVGPSTPVTAPSGALPTTLGGTTVTINGAPAPIAYTSALITNIQVPTTVTPGSTANLQVIVNGLGGAIVPLSVVGAVPGIYTATATIGGAGAIKAVNQDGSLNSKLKPAARGSVISLYVNGLGAVSPAVPAGAVSPGSPLSTVTGGVGAFIGGVPAMVTFSGLAPGLVGVYQVNVQIPMTAPSGTPELQIFSNSTSASSQAGATIQVQ